MPAELDHLEFYRLPWNYADNGISWLEPTTDCNLRCEGCYRDPHGHGHKTLEDVRADLEVFKKLRKSDCMSIAGGDPLVYPQIVELVKMINEMGWKPVINTNGLALKEPLLKELKKAGVFGFTFHIDTSQKRPKVTATTETELNELRLHYAKMLAQEGGIACSFNATISDKTMHEIPNMVRWSEKYADIVHTMVFILYRSPNLTGDFDFFANGNKIEFDGTYKETNWGGEQMLMAPDIVEKIREGDPMYEPCAYLNGTANPNSLKWLLANRIVLNKETLGYVSPKFMELVQTLTHMFTGKYLAYAQPKSVSKGKLASFFAGFVDKEMRRIFSKIMRRTIANPINLFRSAYIQSFMIIQPVNFESDGRQDMCDSCPDITVHDGKLVWSCRLEEMNNYGAFVQTIPKRA
ncbi:MAG: radical SAM protein [Desulfobacterales bacterium]|nr:MAG: radical SAM protein [Desulfobacterales bacterium]